MFAVMKAGAKLGAKGGSKLFKAGASKGMAFGSKGAALGKRFSTSFATGLKDKAKAMTNTVRSRATNFLDAQKRRIFQTDRGAVYTNTSGGNRNYNPTPNYHNVPGSNVVTPLNNANRPNMRNNKSY